MWILYFLKLKTKLENPTKPEMQDTEGLDY